MSTGSSPSPLPSRLPAPSPARPPARPPARRLIYLHGFRSSSQSFKARLLAARLEQIGLGDRFFAPDLPPSPAVAVASVIEELCPDDRDLLVGSSLGGCYALHLAEACAARAVLLNPAVHASRDLVGHVGEQVGYHDGLPFWFDRDYLAELKRLEDVDIADPQRYLLIAAKGDEVLDWREMVARFPDSPRLLLEGSDHGLSNFADLIDDVLAFGGLLPAGGDCGPPGDAADRPSTLSCR